MSGEVRVELGGIGLLFRHKNYRIKEDRNTGLYIKDFIHPGRNDFIIDVEVGGLPKYPRENMLFQPRENWRLYRNDGRDIFETYKPPDEITRICIMENNLSELAELRFRMLKAWLKEFPELREKTKKWLCLEEEKAKK